MASTHSPALLYPVLVVRGRRGRWHDHETASRMVDAPAGLDPLGFHGILRSGSLARRGSGAKRTRLSLLGSRTLAHSPQRLPDHMGEAMARTSANQSNPPGPAIRGIAIKRPGRYLLKKKHFCLTTGRNRSQPHSEPAINSLPLKSSLKPYVLKILWRFTQGGSAPN